MQEQEPMQTKRCILHTIALSKEIAGERKEGELRRTKKIREKPWRTHRLMNYSTLWTWGGAKIFIHTHNYFREWIPRSKVTSPHFEVLRKMRKEPSAWRRLLSRGSSLYFESKSLGRCPFSSRASGNVSSSFLAGPRDKGARERTQQLLWVWLLINPRGIQPRECRLSHGSIRLASHVSITGSWLRVEGVYPSTHRWSPYNNLSPLLHQRARWCAAGVHPVPFSEPADPHAPASMHARESRPLTIPTDPFGCGSASFPLYHLWSLQRQPHWDLTARGPYLIEEPDWSSYPLTGDHWPPDCKPGGFTPAVSGQGIVHRSWAHEPRAKDNVLF